MMVRDHSHTAARRAAHGFTLVELLVVIGIIALLIGILMPSLSKARQAAKKTYCLSNLRSLGQAVAVYRAENKGSFPPAATTVVSNHWNVPHVWSLLKLGNRSAARYCPTVEEQLERAPIPPANQKDRFHVSYLYSELVGGQDTRNGRFRPTVVPGSSPTLRIASPAKGIPNSSQTMLFMDYPQMVVMSAVDDRGMWHGTQKSDVPLLQTVEGERHQVFVYVAPVHNVRKTSALNKFFANGSPAMMGEVNILYCDGSARPQTVRQGQEGLATDTRKGPQVLLDNSTMNGHILAGGRATIPDTRLDPYLTP